MLRPFNISAKQPCQTSFGFETGRWFWSFTTIKKFHKTSQEVTFAKNIYQTHPPDCQRSIYPTNQRFC
jgi:hypothetical protein